MKIGATNIGLEFPPYIIAEIGVNHDGSMERALQLTNLAKETGANAVKFQYFAADLLMSRSAKLAAYQRSQGESDPVEMLRRLELTIDQLQSLVECAHSIGLHAILTVFSLELVAPADSLPWDTFKSASPDIVNLPLLQELSTTEKPLIISTGAAHANEIKTAITASLGSAYLHCVSAYPTPNHHAQLAGISALSTLIQEATPNTEIPVGYSDHTVSEQTGALAVAAGASILEKHFTDDNSRPGPDHAASLEPHAFQNYVKQAHHAWKMMGERAIVIQDIEQDVRTVSRQSVATTRPLRKSQTITRTDITIKRPGTGIPPSKLETVIGKCLRHDMDGGTIITADDLRDPIRK